MKKWSFALLLALLAMPFSHLYAQLGITLEFQKRVFLQYEPVIARVTLRNDCGQTLLFGKDERLRGKLKFEIMNREKRLVAELEPDDPMIEGVIIKSGESQELFVLLNRYYDLTGMDKYDIKCYVSHPALGKDYESNSKYLEISAGVPEWSRSVGLPAYMVDSAKPDQETQRTYKVVSLLNNGRKELFVSVEDNKFVYAVRRVCTVLAQEKFAAEVDHLGRLHLFVPVMPKKFKYIIIALDGEVDLETEYSSSTTIPVMARDPKSGKVYIVGGEETQRDDSLI